MISIIIPALNEESNIAALLNEIEKRSCGYIREIILADGGSTDKTREVAKKSGVRVLSCTKKGRAVQMNEGAAVASGNILYFLHADSIPPEEFDQQITQAVNRNIPAGSFRLQFTSTHFLLRFYSWFTRFSFTLFRFGDQSLFVKKSLFNQIDGFDESLILMEDQDIVRRLKEQTPVMVLPDVVKTSARKYEENGMLKLQFIFTVILVAYYMGARQKTLVHLYQSLIKKP